MPLMERSPAMIVFLVAAAFAFQWAQLAASRFGEEMLRPLPHGRGEEDWDFVRSAGLASTGTVVWEKLGDPETFLRIAFGRLAYSTMASSPGSSTFIVELPSGEEMFLNLQDSNQDQMYHVFEVAGHTGGIFNGPSLEGSELFIWAVGPPGTRSFVQAEIGWLGSVSPSQSHQKVNTIMDGLILTLLDNLRIEFGAGDCVLSPFKRTTTGICNNPDHPSWGTPLTVLRRLDLNDPAYKDGMTSPSGTNVSARLISNVLCSETNSTEDDATNSHLLTDMFVFFGQFIDHDLGLSPTGVLNTAHQPLFNIGTQKFHEKMPIPMPEADAFMLNLTEMEFERTVWAREDNREIIPRQHLNQLSAFLDLGQVYGSDQIRARALRSMKDGKLRTSEGNLLPYNGDVGQDSVGLALNNDPDASSEYFAAGDVRANENILLTAFHVLWLREHNKVADELSGAFPDFGDELLFDIARSLVIAEYQSIVYNEWLPRLLGPDQLPAADYAYNKSLDPSISTFFSTAAFRFGHSMVNKFLWVSKKSGDARQDSNKNTETVPLKEAFFNPQRFREAGLDGLLLGAAWHHAPELDVKIVDDIRNFLFIEETDDEIPEKDLAAFNIQRGRDMGLPSYNDARESFSLTRLGKSDFFSITKDKVVARSLAQLYGGDVSNVDAFIGGLAEAPVPGSILGPLFFAAIKDQFQRLRDADRLFYKNLVIPPTVISAYPRALDILNEDVTLSDVIVRNTDLSHADLTGPLRNSVFDVVVDGNIP